jgi:hypothetical protein
MISPGDLGRQHVVIITRPRALRDPSRTFVRMLETPSGGRYVARAIRGETRK